MQRQWASWCHFQVHLSLQVFNLKLCTYFITRFRHTSKTFLIKNLRKQTFIECFLLCCNKRLAAIVWLIIGTVPVVVAAATRWCRFRFGHALCRCTRIGRFSSTRIVDGWCGVSVSIRLVLVVGTYTIAAVLTCNTRGRIRTRFSYSFGSFRHEFGRKYVETRLVHENKSFRTQTVVFRC
jgi:hypothetical protein